MNGLTTTEFKLLCPDYKDIEGDVLWNRMEDYMLMRSKYKNYLANSEYMDYVFPNVKITTVQQTIHRFFYTTEFRTHMRIQNKNNGWYYIVNYVSNFESQILDNNTLKFFLEKCYIEVYNHLHLYIVNDNHVDSETSFPINRFDVYQGSEYYRLMNRKWKMNME